MLFELDDISHYYGHFQALNKLTVQVESGAIGLLGPNGAGKTTLIKVLLGLLDPWSGEVRCLEHDVRRHAVSIRRRVGYMPEQEAFFSDLSGFEAVVYSARLSGLPKAQAFQRAHEVLDFAGLDEARYRLCSSYSTGMKQRIKLAQALVHGPELVFLDEPTNGLDPQGREDMLELIEQLKKIPVNVVLSSHLMRDVERVCDHVLVLVQGQLKHFGSLADLTAGSHDQYRVQVKRNGHHLLSRLKESGLVVQELPHIDDSLLVSLNNEQIPRFWELVIQSEVQVRHFAPETMSLERAFVDLVEQA
ncbi:MAG TPA: ABC transporter ATP-binding protein [Myxococcales bacterium]|nr:ABC transporter ATP-binding protein [Myxococcales bacterium]